MVVGLSLTCAAFGVVVWRDLLGIRTEFEFFDDFWVKFYGMEWPWVGAFTDFGTF